MPLLIKRILIAVSVLILIGVLLVAASFIKQSITDRSINDDFSGVFSRADYKTPVAVKGIEVMKQEISCGYACIELLARWQGKDITENALFAQNDGKITTAMGNGFVNEVNKQFPEFCTTKYANLKNTELIDRVYTSLKNHMPVPFEFAALHTDGDTGVWTLHLAIITALDIENDIITISNPYGYRETYTLSDFLQATRYESYENMEFPFRLGFLAGVFTKNTIYLLEEH
ncbi:MAG: hypothetical protein LBU07_01285 [Coriobacteriales bacterium]|jgi:hypothetical protein|nr:hypothetical protein [Coriobacteriales bacterium]